jgi:hypothetical protein
MNKLQLIKDSKSVFDRITYDNEEEAYIYKKNGKLVKDNDLYQMLKSEVKKNVAKQEKLAIRLVNGNISFEDYQANQKELIKRNHVNMTRKAKGGSENTFANDYLNAGRDLKDIHYPAARSLAEDVKDGKLTEKEFIARAKLFGYATKNTFEKTRVNHAKDSDKLEARRLLGSCQNHCDDCIRYASFGWIDADKIIPPGSECACRMRCCCSVEYRKKEKG